MFDQLFGVAIKLTNVALHTIKTDVVEFIVEREYQLQIFCKNVGIDAIIHSCRMNNSIDSLVGIEAGYEHRTESIWKPFTNCSLEQ